MTPYAAPDIHVPIAILLIQILDVIFHSIQKSHYTILFLDARYNFYHSVTFKSLDLSL